METRKRILFLGLLISMVLGGTVFISSSVLAAETEQVVSGTCGEKVNYELDLSTGVLCIYGSGPIDDYKTLTKGEIAPWMEEGYGAKIIKVEIKSGVTYVGANTFRGGGYKTEYDYCENLETIEMAETVTEIGAQAFSWCSNLQSITIPDSVKTIGIRAFEGSSILDIQWGSSLEKIDMEAFMYTTIPELCLPEGLETVGERSFSSCEDLKRVVVPDNCELYHSAFEKCTTLESVVIGKNCKLQGEIFRSCSSLKDVSIGEGSISVASGPGMCGLTFWECTNLQTIYLPDSWEFYGNQGEYSMQFFGCINLTDIRFSETNSKYKIVDSVVYSKDGSNLVYYPLFLTETEYEIPEGVTAILANAFNGQEYLEHVTIPASVQEIGARAFQGCQKLNNVIVPEGVTELGTGIFVSCKNLHSIVLPASLSFIDTNYKNATATFNGAGLEFIYGEEGSYVQKLAEEREVSDKFHQTVYCLFDADGGNVGLEKKPIIPNDKYRSLPIPVREGYDFLGWYTDSGDEVIDDTIVSAEKNHTLYAHWKKANEENNENNNGSNESGNGNNESSNENNESTNGNKTEDNNPEKVIKDLTKAALELSFSSVFYDGTSKQPAVTVRLDGIKLENGKDFIVGYSDNVNAGTGKVMVRGIGLFSGIKEASFQINARPINEFSVGEVKDEIYTGEKLMPPVMIKNSGKELKKGKDYTVTYKNNKVVGSATILITGMGNYTGNITKTFTIRPKTTSISKTISKKKGFALKWKKQAIQTTGYQIQYSTSSKFAKKNTKTLTLKKNSITSKSITKLKTGKKYYVRIRTYKNAKVNGKTTKIYSSWSKIKKVTTKK